MLKKFLFTIPLFLLVLCSCVAGENRQPIQISPSDKNFMDLVSERYHDLQLSELAGFDGSLNELNAEYPVECLRKIGDTYRVSYLGDERIAVLLFDDSGKKLSGNVYRTRLLKSDFDGLDKGRSLEEVRAIDPDGEYLFLITGRNDTPKVSSHYTKDGYLITFEYDASNIIVNVSKVRI